MSRNQRRQAAQRTGKTAVAPLPVSVDQMFADAVSHHMAGRDDKAEQLYLSILAVPPIQAETSYNLGLLYQTKGRFAEAVAAYRNATLMRQDHVDAYCNMATALQDLGLKDDAIALYHKAIAIRPDYAMAYCNMGVALKERDQSLTAVDAYERAIILRPDYDWAFANLSAVLLDLDRLEEAITACRAALAINQKLPMAHFNLGAIFKAQNRLPESEASFRDAIALNPDFVEAHFTFGQVLLHQQKFAEGWAEYDWRWRLPTYRWLKNIHGDFTQPAWQGEDIRGKTLLVYAEQGLGDALQYVRYIPHVIATTGAKVILAVHPPLLRLFGQIAGATLIALDHVPLPPFDLHCPLLTLPRLLGTTSQTIPAQIPYLHAEPADIARWQARLAAPAGHKKVGIVWAGNPDQTGDRLRSPRLEAVLPLFDVPGITFFALQLGAGRNDLDQFPLPANVIDLGPEITDFSDSAAIMSGLDVMISSCTAPLHLAAALGVRTWGMIPFAPHFLWQNDRSDSPWYPTLTLYRQAELGKDWSNVMEQIAADLKAL